MRTVFADTAYWIAILVPGDGLHSKAVEVSKGLGKHRIVTSEMVLAETLNSLSDYGSHIRKAAAELADQLREITSARVVPQTSIQFREALKLYALRDDKKWSLTDCASILIMEQEGISETLTSDHHFEQAGFAILLK